MTTVYLVRHGQPDWPAMNARGLPGGVNDLVPVTDLGIKQSEQVAEQLRDCDAVRVVSSPMTRALQTAAIISSELRLPLSVEFDLREWVVDDTYRWIGPPPRSVIEEFVNSGGEWAPDSTRAWEPLSEVRRRVTTVLDRITDDGGTTIVVAHAIVIQSITGELTTALGGIRALNGVSRSCTFD